MIFSDLVIGPNPEALKNALKVPVRLTFMGGERRCVKTKTLSIIYSVHIMSLFRRAKSENMQTTEPMSFIRVLAILKECLLVIYSMETLYLHLKRPYFSCLFTAGLKPALSTLLAANGPSLGSG